MTALGACAVPHAVRSPAVSQRAAVSSDTQTAPEGVFELEIGLDLDPGDEASAPTSLLHGAGPSTELFVESSPFSFVDGADGSQTGVGDLLLGVRQRISDGSPEEPSYAVHLVTKVPTAETGIGTGEFAAFVAGSASYGFDLAWVTAYYELGILGEPGPGTAIQHLWAVSAAQAWTPALGGFVELASVADSDVAGAEPTSLLASVVWDVAARVGLDAGVVLPLDDDAEGARIVVGATVGP